MDIVVVDTCLMQQLVAKGPRAIQRLRAQLYDPWLVFLIASIPTVYQNLFEAPWIRTASGEVDHQRLARLFIEFVHNAGNQGHHGAAFLDWSEDFMLNFLEGGRMVDGNLNATDLYVVAAAITLQELAAMEGSGATVRFCSYRHDQYSAVFPHAEPPPDL